MYMDGSGPYSRSTRDGVITAPLAMPGMSQTIEGDALRAILRGETPLENFKSAGVAVYARRIEGSVSGRRMAPVVVSAADLAEGISNLKDDPVALAEWASFILVMSELFEFDVDSSDYCDRLVASLWDIALGAPLGESVLRLATAARKHFRKI
ncbi:MAG: hypothetical protein P4L57_09235 [Rhizomicrobium sp.]|nr:hypothetical protein [Rhizomicrobium sp.]